MDVGRTRAGIAGRHADRFLLLRLLSWGFRILRPLRLPALRFVRPARRRVKFDQPVERFGDAGLAALGDGFLALLHSLIPLYQQRFGLGVLLPAQERSAEQRLGIEQRPGVGLLLL